MEQLANYKKDLGLDVGFKSPSEIQEEKRAKAAGWEGKAKWDAEKKAAWNAAIDKELMNPVPFPRR